MEEGEKPLQAFKGKTALILASSAGALGGMRVLVVLRMLLGNIGVHVIPSQKAIGKVNTLIDESGVLSDEKTLGQLQKLADELVQTTLKLNA
jgi:NAD(P)H-dependent FMN reductase